MAIHSGYYYFGEHMKNQVIFDPAVIVSEEALERKKKFRKNKEANGLVDKVSSLSKPVNVYFDDHGEIVCVTKDTEFPIDESWNTFDFTPDEIRTLKNRSFSEFLVVKKDSHDNNDIYEIKLRNSSKQHSITHETTFQEVVLTPSWDTDLTELEVSMSKDNITLQLLPQGLEYLAKYKDSNYQIKNQKVLSIYITLKKNPHYLIHDFKVPLVDFLSGDPVIVELEQDFTPYSIYTKPVFKYCARV